MSGQQRRTRAEKERAQLHRQETLSYTFQAGQVQTAGQLVTKTTPATAAAGPVRSLKGAPASKNVSLADLFAYDVRLIYRDLGKTVMITALILATILGIRFGLG